MGVLLGDGKANFVVTISSIFLLTRLSIAERLLEGLSVFHAYSGDGDTSSEPTGSKGKSRHARWLNKSAVRQKVFIDGAERVVKARLPLGAGSKCVNYGELDILVNIAIVLIANAIVCALPLPSQIASTHWLLLVAAVVPGAVLYLLSRVEIISGVIGRNDKKYVGYACVILSALAFGALQLPSSLLDFDWTSSAADAQQALTRARQRLHVSPETVDELEIPVAGLKAVVAMAAGCLGGCMMPAALRGSRSYLLAVQPPPATGKYTNIGWTGQLRLQAAMIAPFLLAVAWVRPMTQGLLALSDDTTDLARASLLLATSAAYYLAVRPFLRGYLSSGLVVWWTYKHAMTSWDKNARIGELIQLRVRNINVLMCKVAVEFLAPAVLWTACGVLLLFTCASKDSIPGYGRLLSMQSPSGSVANQNESSAPTIAIANICGFLAWWTCLTWSVGVSAFLSLFRTGMLNEV